jgi:hypothetical protein
MPGGAPGDEHHAGGAACDTPHHRGFQDELATLFTIAIEAGVPVKFARCLRASSSAGRTRSYAFPRGYAPAREGHFDEEG